MKKHDAYLYHATYRAYKDDISRFGLKRPGGRSNYKTYAGEYIYLSATAKEAEDYARAATNVPEDWLNNIVIFKVRVPMEDLELEPSGKFELTYAYPYDIKPEDVSCYKIFFPIPV